MMVRYRIPTGQRSQQRTNEKEHDLPFVRVGSDWTTGTLELSLLGQCMVQFDRQRARERESVREKAREHARERESVLGSE